jgi:hypothetical protein
MEDFLGFAPVVADAAVTAILGISLFFFLIDKTTLS